MRHLCLALSIALGSSIAACAPAAPPKPTAVGLWDIDMLPGRQAVFDEKMNCKLIVPGESDQKCLWAISPDSTQYQQLYGDYIKGNVDWIDTNHFRISLLHGVKDTIVFEFKRITT